MVLGLYPDELLEQKQLVKLSQHKYSSSGSTLFDPFMQVFWNWFVQKLPMSIAPNALTITGLIINVITTIILIYYSPDGRQEVRTSIIVSRFEVSWFMIILQTSSEINNYLHRYYLFYLNHRFQPGHSFYLPWDCLCIKHWMQLMANRHDGPDQVHLLENYLIMAVIPSPLVRQFFLQNPKWFRSQWLIFNTYVNSVRSIGYMC